MLIFKSKVVLNMLFGRGVGPMYFPLLVGGCQGRFAHAFALLVPLSLTICELAHVKDFAPARQEIGCQERIGRGPLTYVGLMCL